MFILIAIIMIICGILLLIKARKMPKDKYLNIVVATCAIVFIILGSILACGVISGKIELPL